MKTTTFLTPILVAAALLCASSFPAAAQVQGGRGMGGVLTQDQRTKLREAMQASRSELTQLNEKLATALKEAVAAVLAKDASEKTVLPKIEAVHKIQTDIAILRLKGVKEIASTITEEQKAQMQERPGMGYNMLLGGFGGMGGGMGGGGGGGNQ
jgi:Spy/CpxP family protein refolding chaperone